MMKVLLIDDDEMTINLYSQCLSRLSFSIESCQNFSHALQQIHTQAFDLYLIDVNLPDGDGRELLPYLAQSSHDCQIIILTGDETSSYSNTPLPNLSFLYKKTPIHQNIQFIQALMRID